LEPWSLNRPMDAPRIAIVSPRFEPNIGGMESYVAAITEALALYPLQLEVLTQSSPDIVRNRGHLEQYPGYSVRRFALLVDRMPDVPAPSLARFLALNAGRYDLIHAHNYHALPLLLASVASRNSLVLSPHYHGTRSSRFGDLVNRVYLPAGRWAVRKADHLVANSVAEAELIERDLGPGLREKVTVIPEAPTIRRRDRSRSAGSVPLVLSVGRLVRYKRVDLVVRAVSHMPSALQLVIVGDGPARKELQALTQRLGLSERIGFLGEIHEAELASLVSRASASVTLSSSESYGRALADSVAAGLPTVASDIPPHREIYRLAFGSSVPGHMALVAVEPASHRSLHDERDAVDVARKLQRVLAADPLHTTGKVMDHHLPTTADMAESMFQVYVRLLRHTQ